MTGPDDGAAVRVRPATRGDVDALARHRVEMFRDMRSIAPEAAAALLAATRAYLLEAMASGEYVAWVAEPADAPREVVGGAGLQLRPLIPRPHRHDRARVIAGLTGLVVNVYTEPAWRRRGVARLLMGAVIAQAERIGLAELVLHASDEGRPLYAQLGFVPTSEMRYEGPRTDDERG